MALFNCNRVRPTIKILSIVYVFAIAAAVISSYIGANYTLPKTYGFLYSISVYFILTSTTLSFKNKGSALFTANSIFWITTSILIGIYYVANHNHFWNASSIWSYVIFIRIFMGAFFEELLFRKYVVDYLYDAKYSVLLTAIFSTLLFSVFHSVNLFKAPLAAVINQMVYAFIMGALYFLSRRVTSSWAAAILPHLLSNLALGSYAYFDLDQYLLQ
ncbi:CPBP family intramembrane glutamic endopeptidase [Lewinella sp. 4G2]|uniref:CPBP family intramembrane glutamic endopeptidase n=1 Tax=Lewinella sp. 4G2 TaxID=1803372 RepID=UPI0007B46B9F|nr:hypothetical protein A3850_001500 [Lewinella sp. 4G2]